jgi:hypothetical protein
VGLRTSTSSTRANFAIDQGFGEAFQSVVEPEGFADLAKGKLD